jgi:hypothetical protein
VSVAAKTHKFEDLPDLRVSNLRILNCVFLFFERAHGAAGTENGEGRGGGGWRDASRDLYEDLSSVLSKFDKRCSLKREKACKRVVFCAF